MKPKKEEFIDSLIDGEMINSIYGYSYKRCFSKDEAEELCQEIITEILIALTNDDEVSNLNAYIWQVANNTYINHINMNKRLHNTSCSFDDSLSNIAAIATDNMEDEIIERIINREQLIVIKREIASLSEIYRDVMVMFYLEELPIPVIAKRLNIPQNRVKQRLHTARIKIRKGVNELSISEHANKSPKLYDLQLANFGGVGLFIYDPRDKIQSSLLRKNIIISCKDKAKSIDELSVEFNVQLEIIKDEIKQIPEDFLKKTSGGKYIANSIIVDPELQEKADKLTANIAADYFKDVKEYLLTKKNDIMKLPFINPPRSFEYLLWWYLPQFADTVKWSVNAKLEEKRKEKGLKMKDRKMYLFCSIVDPENKNDIIKIKNHNGIWNVFNLLGKNEEVRIENISLNNYLPHEKGRFYADQSFNRYPELAMVFKTINGLDIALINESDKEATARALEKGYIRKENGKLYPNVIVATDIVYEALKWYKYGTDETGKPNQITAIAEKYADKIADELWIYANKYLPEHLLYQCSFLADGLICLEYYLLEEGVKDGILYKLPETGCSEGIFATVLYPRLMVLYEKSEYKISKVLKGGIGEKINLQKGDIMVAVNGVNWTEYFDLKKWINCKGEIWKDGDVITVNRDGADINFTVTF